MKPLYIPNFINEPGIDRLINEVTWLNKADTRQEYFMSHKPVSYTYGKGRGIRTYESNDFAVGIDKVMESVNEELAKYNWGPLNVCFLNYYKDASQHLGWHADDHSGTDQNRPIAVVSFGEPREIWWRINNTMGVVPSENRQLLGDGSLFVMPPGFQGDYQHRIPKGDHNMGPRVSLTFRAFME